MKRSRKEHSFRGSGYEMKEKNTMLIECEARVRRRVCCYSCHFSKQGQISTSKDKRGASGNREAANTESRRDLHWVGWEYMDQWQNFWSVRMNAIFKPREIWRGRGVAMAVHFQRDFMAELQLESFPVYCQSWALSGRQTVSVSLMMRPYPTIFKGTGVRRKITGNSGGLMKWGE